MNRNKKFKKKKLLFFLKIRAFSSLILSKNNIVKETNTILENQTTIRKPAEEEIKQGVLMNENKKSIQTYVLGKFTKENVFKSLNNAITNCIINFKNKN